MYVILDDRTLSATAVYLPVDVCFVRSISYSVPGIVDHIIPYEDNGLGIAWKREGRELLAVFLHQDCCAGIPYTLIYTEHFVCRSKYSVFSSFASSLSGLLHVYFSAVW